MNIGTKENIWFILFNKQLYKYQLITLPVPLKKRDSMDFIINLAFALL